MEQNYKEVAEALGIYNLGNKYPSEISGGQQQRTARPGHSSINQRLFSQMNLLAH